MDEKVIQVMNAPNNLYAMFEDDEDLKNPMESRILCFGLTNMGNVIPMDIDEMGLISDVNEVSNFIGTKWK